MLTGLVVSEGVGVLNAVNLVSSGALFFDGSRVRVARVSEQLSLATEDGLVGSHDVDHDVMEAPWALALGRSPLIFVSRSRPSF